MNKAKLKTHQAAAAVGIHLSTLNEWIASGKVKAPKPVLVGAVGMRLWSPADIARLRVVKQKIYRKGRGRKKGAGT
jgi:predicted site-specific integrase-resolvase